MMTPIAISITLPLSANSLNSFRNPPAFSAPAEAKSFALFSFAISKSPFHLKKIKSTPQLALNKLLSGISDNDTIKSAIKEFKAPEHRLEKIVTSAKGVVFYNDSKATNPEAAIVAINSFNNQDVVLIAGGRDKNTDLTEFCDAVKNHIKTVILIGEATERFEQNLRKNQFNNIIRVDSLEAAIDKGIELNPNVVLLSPACASFDMFNSFEHRGEVFKNYVLSRI